MQKLNVKIFSLQIAPSGVWGSQLSQNTAKVNGQKSNL
jgi:hypothetical protein